MSYKLLRIVGYNDYKKVEKEYNKRITSPSTIKTDLEIYSYSVMKQKRELNRKHPLYFVLLPEILNKIDDIYRNSNIIKQKMSELPKAAPDQLVRSQIIEEIQSTNDIEGVKSTRKEISEAIDTKDKIIRFSGIVNMYFDVYRKKIIKIHELEDFKKIYDQLVLDEINEKDLPDGKLFRKDVVYVTGDGKRVHQGNPTETSIESDLLKLIDFMNNDSYSTIIKAVITHYFFEYIHPYYDGNGRMGRYLLSSYVGAKLDVLTGISISQSIHNNKKKYEDAFLEVSHPKNYGEITTFIIDMLELIVIGQSNVIEKLETSLKKIESAEKYIETLGLTKSESTVLFIMIQSQLFNPVGIMLSNKDLVNASDRLSRYKINQITDSLSEQGFAERVKHNPVVYGLTEKVINVIE